jgi:hypothetical protein
MEQDPNWHIDKHIPLALVGAIMLQTAAGVWWAATTSSRVDGLERDRATAVVAVDTAARNSSAISERMVKLETKFDGMADSLTEIKNILRQPPRQPQ